MKISIITLFPAMIQGFVTESIVKRAAEKGVVEINLVNLRDFATDHYGTVDDRPYGGGAGMILKAEPIAKALELAVAADTQEVARKTVLTSPRGKTYTQATAREFAALDHLVIFAGHYEGMDERASALFDEELSIGDFVMTGGEIAAAAVVDSVVRLIPGALKKEGAAEGDSFFSVPLDDLLSIVGDQPELAAIKARGGSQVTMLEYPHYTRPELFNGVKVPDVLLQGNHKEIDKWRLKSAFEVTRERRPDLLR